MTTRDHTDRIIVGTDGTPVSTSALEWAVTEADRRGVELDVILAWHSPWLGLTEAGVAEVDPAPVRAAGEAALGAALNRLGGRGAGVDIRVMPLEGRAARVLIERSPGAAMLVVGTGEHHRPALRVGSVARQCAFHAHCPVVVVPTGWTAPAGPERVVVGVDGSPGSVRALRWAAAAAAAHDAALEVVHAWHVIQPVPEPWGMAFAIDRELVAKESDRMLDEVTTGLRDDVPGLRDVRLVPVAGYPVESLCTAARDANLLVVGSRGRGGFARLLLGSVAEQCLHRAACPVAIVRSEREHE